jgi:hypothetical protein
MTADELVHEGLDFLKAFPSANRKRVEAHLWSVVEGGSTREEARDNRDTLATWGGPEGCLIGLLLMPIRAGIQAINRWRHGGAVRAAMRELYPDDRPRRRRE